MLSSAVQNNTEVLIAELSGHMTGYSGGQAALPRSLWSMGCGGGEGKKRSLKLFKYRGSIKFMRVWKECFSVFS